MKNFVHMETLTLTLKGFRIDVRDSEMLTIYNDIWKDIRDVIIVVRKMVSGSVLVW